MNNSSPTRALQIMLEKRILNEFASKILNEEKMEQHTRAQTGRLSEFSEVPFHCECDDENCTAFISMSTEEYQGVHTKTRNFVVVPDHVRLDIEEIITSFSKFAVVGKFFPHPNNT